MWIKDQGPVKVEAKVWLANQRTYIKWQHVSVLLASLSLGLYNAAGEGNNIARALAVVYTCIAAFTLAWGYGMYMYRARLIRERSGKDFDSILGPLVVCLEGGRHQQHHQLMRGRDHPKHNGARLWDHRPDILEEGKGDLTEEDGRQNRLTSLKRRSGLLDLAVSVSTIGKREK